PPLLTICPQFASHSHALHRDPHPFPTRRSSDLGHGTPCPYTRAINMRDQIVKDAKRLVLKVGSRLVASKGSGLNTERIDRLASELAALKAQGREIVMVSSGAIVCGIEKLG